MKPLEILEETLAPDGTDMKLARRGNEIIILANGKTLMSSRMHGSEEALATFGCRRARRMEQPCVLVGGLGMGFTLRATLDVLPPGANVVVAELVWSAGDDRKFEQRLRYSGFQVEVERVRARLKKGGPRHTIFLSHAFAHGMLKK